MRRTAADQQSAFQSDYFLTQLCHFTEAKFSLFEHAPLPERRDRFRNHVEREEMPLTFCKMGINIPVKLEWSQTSGHEISFRSRPFFFNDIWVKVTGTMNSETLDGRVRFERAPQTANEEPGGLTEAQIASLRRDGLPI